jgi:hypothetical protein
MSASGEGEGSKSLLVGQRPRASVARRHSAGWSNYLEQSARNPRHARTVASSHRLAWILSALQPAGTAA